jgi:hypothetical protein
MSHATNRPHERAPKARVAFSYLDTSSLTRLHRALARSGARAGGSSAARPNSRDATAPAVHHKRSRGYMRRRLLHSQ